MIGLLALARALAIRREWSFASGLVGNGVIAPEAIAAALAIPAGVAT